MVYDKEPDIVYYEHDKGVAVWQCSHVLSIKEGDFLEVFYFSKTCLFFQKRIKRQYFEQSVSTIDFQKYTGCNFVCDSQLDCIFYRDRIYCLDFSTTLKFWFKH